MADTINYHPVHMNTQLLLDLKANAKGVSVHFSEKEDFDAVESALVQQGFAVLPLDGKTIRSRDDLFRAFADALRKPKGWYGEEEFAPNADAFLEYLDDVVEWIPASGYVIVLGNAEVFWHKQPRLAGLLVELWQFATNHRDAKPHLLFVW